MLRAMKKTTRPILMIFSLVCMGLLPKAHAVSPPPDGDYPGGNTAEGFAALFSLTTGGYNTAVGILSLRNDTTGGYNTAIGAGALLANNADQNTATGTGALLSNTAGAANTGNGAFALYNNATASNNTGTGAFALFHNIGGAQNTASGAYALYGNTTAANNTANGILALYFNNGFNNTAIGASALLSNTSGANNTAVGFQALTNNTTGDANVCVGHNAGQGLVTGSDNVYIGTAVSAAANQESNTTRIRNVGSTPIVNGINVVIDAIGGFGDGRLGYASSSRRYKQEIQPMEKASQSLFRLNPVTFHAKGNAGDTARVKHYGLIAEEVATVDPDLVVFNPEGKPETLRFDSINAMLLNEFLKEHRTVQELKKEIAALTASVKEQAAQIQKVSAQIEVSKAAPQVVVNKP